jgi:hypothetical protein
MMEGHKQNISDLGLLNHIPVSITMSSSLLSTNIRNSYSFPVSVERYLLSSVLTLAGQ